ncbi:MAG: bifunctional riboflavin kinase/FAD synthetase [Anaerolineae bacterium]|nr:bifunctional riboflavin kinase/FAD synthetase [Anaerolineae bacterium]
MRHVHNLTEVQLDASSIVTIGNFDGVHRGHQDLIIKQVRQARAQRERSVVLTFFPHPARVIKKTRGRFYLTTPEDRAALLGGLGVDLVITQPFDEALRHTRAAVFIDGLVQHLHMRSLWVGADFALGYKREGDVPFLTRLGEERGFTVRVIEMLNAEDDDQKISSSSIREALRWGAVEQAARDLGRWYKVEGPVAEGMRRGRTVGFPTANVQVWGEQVLPARGVYAGWAWIGGERHPAVTNIGVRPTFDDDGTPTVEVHLLDFDGDLYGQQLVFEFVTRLRGEHRFEFVDSLAAQIEQDIERARMYLKMVK